MTDVRRDRTGRVWPINAEAARSEGIPVVDPWDLLDQAQGVQRELEAKLAGLDRIYAQRITESIESRKEIKALEAKLVDCDRLHAASLERERKLEARIARMQPIVDLAIKDRNWQHGHGIYDLLARRVDDYERATGADVVK